MNSEEINALVDEKVKAATDPLKKQITALGKEVKEIKEAAPANPADAKPKVVELPKIPGKVMKSGDLKVQFTLGSFHHNGKLIITEAETENQALIDELVKNQTHNKRGFQDGVLKQVN